MDNIQWIANKIKEISESLIAISKRVRRLESLSHSNITGGGGGAGTGDMLKAVYDPDNSGIVNDAERLGGSLPAAFMMDAEHTAIGNSSPHHAPITLGTDSDTILGLTGQQIDLDTQTANKVLAGPASGGAADPTFRALVAADVGTGTPDGTKFLKDNMSWSAVSGGHVIKDEGGAGLTQRANLNFVGAGVAATDDAGNNATVVTIPGGGHTILDETVALTNRSKLDFQGLGVAVTDDAGNDKSIVTIPAPSGRAYESQAYVGTQIFRQVLGAAQSSFDITSVPAGYDYIEITIDGRSTNVGDGYILINLNGDATDANYRFLQHTSGSSHSVQVADGRILGEFVGNGANSHTLFVAKLANYDNSSLYKQINARSASRFDATVFYDMLFDVNWENIAAINRITILMNTGNFDVGTVCTVVAYKNQVIGSSSGQPVSVTRESMQIRKTLYDATLGADAASFDVQSIDQTYDSLEIILSVRTTLNAVGEVVKVWFNNDTTATNYRTSYIGNNEAGAASAVVDDSYFGIAISLTGLANSWGTIIAGIPFYSSVNKFKTLISWDNDRQAAAATDYIRQFGINWENVAAINRLTFVGGSGGNILAGSRLQIIGIKDRQIVTDVQNAGGEYIYGKKLLFDQTLTAAGTFDFSNIPQTYDHLEVLITGRSTQAATATAVDMDINGDTTDANYRFSHHNFGTAHDNSVGDDHYFVVPGANSQANDFGIQTFFIPNYTNSQTKNVRLQGEHRRDATVIYTYQDYINWENTAAINRLTFTPQSGSFAIGSRCQIFGYKNMVSGVGVSSGYIGTQLFRQVAPAGGVTSFDITAIPSGYDYLEISIYGKTDNSSTSGEGIALALNNDTTNTNYRRQQLSASVAGGATASWAESRVIFNLGTANNAQDNGSGFARIIGYDSTAFQKSVVSLSASRVNGETEGYAAENAVFWESTSAINRVTLAPTTGGAKFTEGTLCVVIGYKNQILPGGDVSARYTTAAGQSFNNGSEDIVNFGTLDYDTHSAVTVGAAWKYTAPVDGKYHVAATVIIAASTTWTNTEYAYLALFKGGVLYSYLEFVNDHTNANVYVMLKGSDDISLLAGQYIDIRMKQASGGALTLLNDSTFNHAAIHRI